jgi:hydroxyacylglutathione hydrolase
MDLMKTGATSTRALKVVIRSELHVTQIQYVPIPAFRDNYIWLVTDGRHALVVDPGEASPVKAYCAQHGLLITAILLTHHHDDHVGGVAELLSDGPVAGDVAVYGPASEPIEHVTVKLRGGAEVAVSTPDFHCQIMDVPGHTAGHIAYFEPADGNGVPHLFCGDTLFASGCGRLFEGTPEQMLASLDALSELPAATLVHCAHEYTLSNIGFSKECEPGNHDIRQWETAAHGLRASGEPTLPTTIGHERAVNPFLRVDEQAIRESLATRFHMRVGDRLTAFTLMRKWKDNFQ